MSGRAQVRWTLATGFSRTQHMSLAPSQAVGCRSPIKRSRNVIVEYAATSVSCPYLLSSETTAKGTGLEINSGNT